MKYLLVLILALLVSACATTRPQDRAFLKSIGLDSFFNGKLIKTENEVVITKRKNIIICSKRMDAPWHKSDITGDVFKTINECEDSPNYNRVKSKTEDHQITSYQNRIRCELKVTASKEKHKVLSNHLFSSLLICKNSREFRKEINLSIKRKNSKRVQKIKTYIKNHYKYHSFQGVTINRKLAIGMPEYLVILSLGSPHKVNKSVFSFGVHKQLIYNNQYVYLQKGIVTSWQNY
jgi:hypothetical protein